MIESGSEKPREHVGILDIIRQLLAMDRLAVKFYRGMSQSPAASALRPIWERMLAEEIRHVRFWLGLEKAAAVGDVPELFEEPAQQLAELEQNLAHCRHLAEQLPATAPEMLKNALFFEFYLMHPGMAELFEFARSNPQSFESIGDYEEHILELLKVVEQTRGCGEELRMFSTAMLRLWRQYQLTSRISAIDPLTGVFNRRGFFNAVRPLANLAQRTGTAVAIFMIDIDDFKRVNDTYGHPAGDSLLTVAGQLLGLAFRSSDVVGRYGGEEFVVFLSTIEQSDILASAEKVRREFARRSADVQPATVSIGVAHGHLPQTPMDGVLDLIKSADRNLYEAKRGGKDRVVFSPTA